MKASPDAGPSAAFSKIDVVTLLFDSSFWNRYLRLAHLVLHSPMGSSGDTTPPWRNTAIFWGGSVDYGLKSICQSECNSFQIKEQGSKTPKVSLEILSRRGMVHQFKVSPPAYF
jgi:hypothetical protein